MSKTLSLALYGALVTLAPIAAQAPARTGDPGGWAPAGVNDPQVRQAAEFAASQLPGGGAVRSVDSASQQVVAGMNYRIELTLADGSRWAVTVYRMLSGQMRLSRSARLASAAPQAAGSLRLARNGLQVRRAGAASVAIAFGASRAQVLDALRFRPAPQTGTNRECGAGPIDFLQWQDGVSLLFQHDRFGGWSLSGKIAGSARQTASASARLWRNCARSAASGFNAPRWATNSPWARSAASSAAPPPARATDLWAGLSCTFR
jgi:hypothetical protein